jgi:hypothetical protein
MAEKKDDFEKYLEEQLKDPEFREEYEKLKKKEKSFSKRKPLTSVRGSSPVDELFIYRLQEKISEN